MLWTISTCSRAKYCLLHSFSWNKSILESDINSLGSGLFSPFKLPCCSAFISWMSFVYDDAQIFIDYFLLIWGLSIYLLATGSFRELFVYQLQTEKGKKKTNLDDWLFCVFGQRVPANRKSRAKSSWQGEDLFLMDKNGESQVSAAGSPVCAGQAAWPCSFFGFLNGSEARLKWH